jgi:hypothetical protein
MAPKTGRMDGRGGLEFEDGANIGVNNEARYTSIAKINSGEYFNTTHQVRYHGGA